MMKTKQSPRLHSQQAPKEKKIEKLKNDKFEGDSYEMIQFIFNWCSEMQNKINEIIERLNEN